MYYILALTLEKDYFWTESADAVGQSILATSTLTYYFTKSNDVSDGENVQPINSQIAASRCMQIMCARAARRNIIPPVTFPNDTKTCTVLSADLIRRTQGFIEHTSLPLS